MERQLLFLLDFDLRTDEEELLQHFRPFLRESVPSASTSSSTLRVRTELHTPKATGSPASVVDASLPSPSSPALRRPSRNPIQLAPPPARRRSSTMSFSSRGSEVSPTESQSSGASCSPITPMDEPASYPGIHYTTPDSRRPSHTTVDHPSLHRRGSLLRIYEASKGVLGLGNKAKEPISRPVNADVDVQVL